MIEFKQGMNPYDTMAIGSGRPYVIGDKCICIRGYTPFSPGSETQIDQIVKSGDVTQIVLSISMTFNICIDSDIFPHYFKRL
jgi:hypothetical protein